ncbi:MAG: 8-amino-7-oxononanoate synthase [Nitrospirota bacterium]|nr:8-amino-7-oxononanoate synthase [Nitrospirota bacterium]
MFEKELKRIEKLHLDRHIISRSSVSGPVIMIKGRKYINFSSNDYLGLAGHPKVIESAIEAVGKYSLGTGASRLLAGGTVLHERLEVRISEFKGTESALVFNSGYAANTGVIPALAHDGAVIFSDELNHASIIDGCRLSRARTVIYRHGDTLQLEKLIKEEGKGEKVVVTDSVFSMDGDIAPLGDLYDICRKYRAVLYIDDAHGTGVLGNGKGALEHFNIRPEPWIVQMGTFSKAMGSFGAFIAGSEDVIRWVLNTARSFIFSTALPPGVIAASIAALRIVRTDRVLIKRLWANRERLVAGIRNAGFDTGGSETPIIPIKTGTIGRALGISGFLYGKGIYAPAVRPPAVREPRVRITVSAAHNDGHIDALLHALEGLD